MLFILRHFLLLFLALFCFGSSLSAQGRTCGMEAYMESLKQDPVRLKEYNTNQRRFKAEKLSVRLNASGQMNTLFIPVAVHFPEADEADRACLEALAQDQIDRINADYQGVNDDISNWNTNSDLYPNTLSGFLDVQFCIATQNHPTDVSGNFIDPDLVEGGRAVTIGYGFEEGTNERDPNWAGYLNILVKDAGATELGHSPLGGNIAAGACVVLNTFAIGSSASGCAGYTSSAPYNLGRTLTHELGHFFSLEHTFSGSCSTDDGFTDTPNISSANYSCPAPGSIDGCEAGEKALTMNYMDYTDDACMYMFTEQQLTDVQAYLNVIENQILIDTINCTSSSSNINMTNGTFNQCEGVLYDSGGNLGNYSSNEDFTLTICPDGGGTSTVLEFISFTTQGGGADELTIYNGSTTSDPIIGTYSGTQTIGTITASNTSGCLTLRFVTNGGVNLAGFEANILCESPCQDIEALIENVVPEISPTGVLVINQGDNVSFEGNANFSIDGTGASYDWDFGDGTSANGTLVDHTFNTIGTFTVTLTIMDTNPFGCFDETTLTVQVLGDYIEVDDTTFTMTELVEDVLIDSPCADVSSIETSTGSDFGSTNGIAYFSSNGENFPFTEGIILSTGNAMSAEGPEQGTIGEGSFDWPGDIDLENAIPDLIAGDTNNATYIQFDFTPYSENISFNFLFASEEYGTFQCTFTDAFAFLLTDVNTGATTNLAIVPETTDPISVLSVRDNTYNSSCASSNESYFGAYYGDTGLPTNQSPTDFRGHTVSMVAQSEVIPYNQYTIKLVIADDGDTNYDSAVFLEAGSFQVGGSIGDDITIESGNALCYGETAILDTQLPAALHVWYLDGEVIPNEISSVLNVTEGGNYTADIIYNEDCVVSDTVFVEFIPSPLEISNVQDLIICNSPGNTFDLTLNNEYVLGGLSSTDYVISYHMSEIDAENNTSTIGIPNNYSNSTNPEVIYVRIEDAISGNCYQTASFEISLSDGPDINEVMDVISCDDFLNDGTEEFNLEDLSLDILGSQATDLYIVTYHTSLVDAASSSANLTSPYTNTINPQPIFVRVESINDPNCFSYSDTALFNLIVDPMALAIPPPELNVCDDDNDGFTLFDFSEYDNIILGGQDPIDFTVSYYSSLEDVDTMSNPLSSPYLNTMINQQTIYVRVQQNGFSQCYGSTQFNLVVNPLPSLQLPTPLEVCDDGTPDGLTEIDLTVKNEEIRGGNPDYSISYYLNQLDADLGTNPLPGLYTNISNPQTVFVRGENINTGCVSTTTLELGVIQAAVANTPPPMEFCDPDNDGYGQFILTDSDDLITGSAPGVTVSYHETLSDANTGANPLLSPYNNVVIDTQTIYARVESATVVTDCATIIDLVLNVYPTPQLVTPTALELCDDNLDQVVQFDLSDSVTELLNGIEVSDVVISYYETEENASSSNNAINTPMAYSNISNPQTVWIRVEYPETGCEKLTSLELIVNPLPVIAQPTPLAICDDLVADAFTAFDLTVKNTEITLGDGSLEVVYYRSLLDAESAVNAILDPTSYTNEGIVPAAPNPQTLHVRVTDLDTGCYDLTTLTIRVLPNPTPSPDPVDLELCDEISSGDGLEVFDLTVDEVFILNGELGVSASYYETLEDAEAGENAITTPEAYTNIETPLQLIYVRVTNDLTGCYTLVDFNIIVHPLPQANVVSDLIACELDTDDIFDFDLEGQTALILGGQDPSIFEVTYHTSLLDAETGLNFLGSPYTNISDPEIIFVSVVNTDTGCRNTELQFNLEVHEAAQAFAPLEFYVLCDDNVETDGDPSNDSVEFDLSVQDAFVLDGQDPLNYTVSYYATQADADQGINALPTLYQNTVNPQVIIARVDNDIQELDDTGALVDSSICYATALLTLNVDPLPIVLIETDYILCVDTNGTEVLAPLEIETDLSSDDYTFIWSDATGAVVGTGSSYAPSQGGTYSLEVFDATLQTQCAAPVEVFSVIESAPPILTAQVTTAAFASTHVIEALATGQGIYEYSLDQGPWGDSGVFVDVTPGEHVVTARDLNGCGETQVVVYVIDYPLYFTPNGDGYNDTWNIVGVANQNNAKILIFDRFGKLLKQISPSGEGWDGTFNGAQLPSSDYWFTLDYTDSITGDFVQMKSHFTLKR